MDEYIVAHFHNPAPGAEAHIAKAFAGPHPDAVRRLGGLSEVQRFDVTGFVSMKRGAYRSISELNFGPRPKAASATRTVHIFKSPQDPCAAG